MERIIEPELLDQLPARDPAAERSRRDLRRLNWWMGHHGILGMELRGKLATGSPVHLVELGAGDGSFAAGMIQPLPQFVASTVSLTLVDRQGLLAECARREFDARGCAVDFQVADVFDWLKRGETAPRHTMIMIANLFLHHFKEAELRELFRLAAARTDLFLACEPRRSRLALAASKMVGLIGCGKVTRHDAVASVRAGFAGKELSALWPDEGGWLLAERSAGWSSHFFSAQRTQ